MTTKRWHRCIYVVIWPKVLWRFMELNVLSATFWPLLEKLIGYAYCQHVQYISAIISNISVYWVLAFGRYRDRETQQNVRHFGSSMAERQRFGCLYTWPCNCKQTLSLRSPIASRTLRSCVVGKYWALFVSRGPWQSYQTSFRTILANNRKKCHSSEYISGFSY